METPIPFIAKPEIPRAVSGRRWLFVPLLATVVGCFLLLTTQISCQQNAGTGHLKPEQSVTLREKPISFESKRRPLMQLNAKIWEFVRLPKDDQLGLSYVFHYLALYSVRSEDYQKEINYLTSVVQKEDVGKKVLGDSVFHLSKFGMAMATGRTSRAQETHRDQGLAELGLLGTPSTLVIEVEGKKRPLSEAIWECVANFYLQEKELAWSAIVLALYLPPQNEWTNRFGEKCTFDQLVDELVKRRFEDNSCAGAHLLEALTLLYIISLEENILSQETQQNLKNRLHTVLDMVIRGQHATGYWRVDWFVGLPEYEKPFDKPHIWTPEDDAESRLLSTAHLVEWMLGLPKEFKVPDETLVQSGQWMWDHLKTKTSKDSTPICPYGHAIRGLELLSRESD